MHSLPPLDAEWLEADGLGGFASGTVGGGRTRRYHALLLAATTPPTGRMVLINGCDVWAETEFAMTPLSTQCYQPGVLAPDGSRYLIAFSHEPWPTWRFRLADGSVLQQDLFVRRGQPTVVLRWRRIERGASPTVELHVRPFLSGRDYHSLHQANPEFRFEPEISDQTIAFHPYSGVPEIRLIANGRYHHEPQWYRNFLYAAELERGLEGLEDLAAPGRFTFDVAHGDAVLICTTAPRSRLGQAIEVLDLADELATHEATRRGRQTSLTHAAEQYVVGGQRGETIIAGYPWFTDWGRDTFIALRGLRLALDNRDIAGAILGAWADTVSEGMLPNRFPDAEAAPEYNSVDASLWFCIAARDWLRESPDRATSPLGRRIRDAVQEIIAGYARGTRFEIHRDDDGLIAAGQPGVQLTWMDAKVNDWVVTPRIGKPVEVQALWLNVLAAFPDLQEHAVAWFEQGRAAFRQRFWNSEQNCLFDVVDVDHVPGTHAASIRPNQIFAIGGLGSCLLPPAQAAAVVETVERQLWVPLGLRTLSPDDPNYRGRCTGSVLERDGAYHQGTAWPWLLGPFVEAWLHVHGDTAETRRLARHRFWEPLRQFRETNGLGHLPEIVDGHPPHTPRGCPFQAWSLGEFVRLDREILKLTD